MRRIALVGVAVAAVAGVAAYMGSASGQSNGDTAPIYGIKIPDGYRDWRLISVKQLTGKQLTGAGGELKQLRAQLGNDLAIKAFRDGTLSSSAQPTYFLFGGTSKDARRTISRKPAKTPHGSMTKLKRSKALRRLGSRKRAIITGK
jgi:hypothetical protein